MAYRYTGYNPDKPAYEGETYDGEVMPPRGEMIRDLMNEEGLSLEEATAIVDSWQGDDDFLWEADDDIPDEDDLPDWDATDMVDEEDFE